MTSGRVVLSVVAASFLLVPGARAGTETGLEVTGPAVKRIAKPVSVPAAPGAAQAPGLRALAPPTAPQELALKSFDAPAFQEGLGKFESVIRNHPTVLQALRLRNDPRFRLLADAARAAFEREFQELMGTRDALLTATRDMDREDQEMARVLDAANVIQARLLRDHPPLTRDGEQYERDLAALNTDSQAHQTAVAGFNSDRENYESRLAALQSEIDAHADDLANYNSECAGRQLPPGPFARCMSWQAAINSRAASLNVRSGQLESVRDSLLTRHARLSAAETELQRRSTAIETRRANLERRVNAYNADRERVIADNKRVTDWHDAILPRWNEQDGKITAWIALLAGFVSRVQPALAAVRPPAERVVPGNMTGNWNERETGVVATSLGALRDTGIRAWLAGNAEFNRAAADGVSPISASGTTLRVKPGFFELNAGGRENLLTFEGGKVFLSGMKDRTVPGGQTLEAWFNGFSGGVGSVISDMRSARHRNENLERYVDLADRHSSFGHLFRAQALELPPPTDPQRRQRWEAAIREFRDHVGPLLEQE